MTQFASRFVSSSLGTVRLKIVVASSLTPMHQALWLCGYVLPSFVDMCCQDLWVCIAKLYGYVLPANLLATPVQYPSQEPSNAGQRMTYRRQVLTLRAGSVPSQTRQVRSDEFQRFVPFPCGLKLYKIPCTAERHVPSPTKYGSAWAQYASMSFNSIEYRTVTSPCFPCG